MKTVAYLRPAPREAIHRKHRQGDEDAAAGVHFQGHGAEPPLPDCIAAHRPREVGRIGAGERLVDYLLTSQCLERLAQPPLVAPELERFERPLPTLTNYDQLLAAEAVQ